MFYENTALTDFNTKDSFIYLLLENVTFWGKSNCQGISEYFNF